MKRISPINSVEPTRPAAAKSNWRRIKRWPEFELDYSKESQVPEGEPDRLEFRGPYQILWQISRPGTEFRTAGDVANRWLQLDG